MIGHVNRRDVPVARLYHMDGKPLHRYGVTEEILRVVGMNDVARKLRRSDGT